MFTKRIVPAAALTAALALMPVLAQAHPGHDHATSLLAGLSHPFSGLDHLLAMLTLGAWAAQLGGRQRWQLPSLFLACLLGGAVFAGSWLSLGAMELGIAGSVVFFGLLLALALRLPATAAFPLVAVFAVFHGLAHGIESPGQSLPLTYVAGFMASSVVLLGAGFALMTLLAAHRRERMLRIAGAAAACFGMLLVA